MSFTWYFFFWKAIPVQYHFRGQDWWILPYFYLVFSPGLYWSCSLILPPRSGASSKSILAVIICKVCESILREVYIFLSFSSFPSVAYYWTVVPVQSPLTPVYPLYLCSFTFTAFDMFNSIIKLVITRGFSFIKLNGNKISFYFSFPILSPTTCSLCFLLAPNTHPTSSYRCILPSLSSWSICSAMPKHGRVCCSGFFLSIPF